MSHWIEEKEMGRGFAAGEGWCMSLWPWRRVYAVVALERNPDCCGEEQGIEREGTACGKEMAVLYMDARWWGDWSLYSQLDV
jgi:hypothetical protein